MNTDVSNTAASVVLLYHRLGAPKLSSLVAGQYVHPSLFRSELKYLAARGWKSVGLDTISERCSEGICPQNEFCMTFDDGYLSVYEHAYPALVERNMTAVVYVVAGSIGGINDWDRRAGDQLEKMMSAEQVREMAESGIEIGSHTMTHPRLTLISDDQLRQEMVDSKAKLEDVIGKEVTSFSYPYGDMDARVVEAAVAAGYSNAVSTKLGIVVDGTSVFEIPRVNVRWNAIGLLLMRKINRARRATELR